MLIETERLIIKEFTLDMVEDVHKNSLDEDNRRFVPDEVFETVEDAQETVEFLMTQYDDNEGPLVYPVFIKDADKNIGHVQMVPMEDGTWEIGYHIAKAYTGNGYATEAVKAFLPVMAKKVGARKVYGICLSENIASIHVLNKCGFEYVFEGVGNYQGEDREIYKSVWRKKDFEYEIIDLPKKEWKGTRIPLDYTTETYYDVETTAGPEGFNIEMKKKKFDTPVTHKSEDYDYPDGLYQDHWEKAEAYGLVKEENGEKKLMACIEICPEEWSNRLMVTELWVADEMHRRGIGTSLMNLAKGKAREQGRRAIILETQSCNTRAIAFYLSQGFELIGFDSCCYTNRDIERKEVRFNMGFFLDKRDSRF